MDEYVISVPLKDRAKHNDDWMDNLTFKGLKILSNNNEKLLVNASPEAINLIKKKYSFLKIEMVMVVIPD